MLSLVERHVANDILLEVKVLVVVKGAGVAMGPAAL
jgi:hypothetical protein